MGIFRVDEEEKIRYIQENREVKVLKKKMGKERGRTKAKQAIQNIILLIVHDCSTYTTNTISGAKMDTKGCVSGFLWKRESVYTKSEIGHH